MTHDHAALCRRMVAAMCDADGIYRQGVTYGDYPVGMRHRMNVTITDLQDLATKAGEQS